MIYGKFIVTDQSYDCLVMKKILFHAPFGLAALLRGDTVKINLLEKTCE